VCETWSGLARYIGHMGLNGVTAIQAFEARGGTFYPSSARQMRNLDQEDCLEITHYLEKVSSTMQGMEVLIRSLDGVRKARIHIMAPGTPVHESRRIPPSPFPDVPPLHSPPLPSPPPRPHPLPHLPRQ
jgi:hypothetical protein